MDLLELYLNNTTNSEFFINFFANFETIAVLLLIGISIPIEFFIMLKSDYIDEMRNKKFKKYLHVHTSGDYLRDIDMNKEFIIITDEFFDNISEHGRKFKWNLNDSKERFLIEYGYKYNIIIFADCGSYSKKYNKIIEYCNYKNYPICRVIDYMPKGWMAQERITLQNGDKVYYYKIDN